LKEKSQTFLWMLQRASAAVLALCVVVHLVTIIYAVQGGLSAGEILARTRGNVGWAAFYALFVIAVAIHAPIGLRSVLMEWASWRSRPRDVVLVIFSALLLMIGMRAVWAVFA
jgi:fumarate reductase subunit C